MAFTRPTLQQIVDRIQSDMTGRLGSQTSTLRRAFVTVLARAVAGAVHLLYGQLEYLSRQIFADTAEDVELIRLASIYGVSQVPAEYAEGNVTVTAVPGVVVPLGYEFKRADDVSYAVTVATTVAGAGSTPVTQAVPVRAILAGVDGNLAAAQPLVGQNPIPNLTPEAVVAAGGITGGADAESIEALRARLLEQTRNKPQGGSAADYIIWAKEVPAVTRAWVYGPNGGTIDEGEVHLFFVRDNDGDGTLIIPDAGEIAAVEDHIEEKRPVTAVVSVFAPTAVVVNFTMSLVPNTAEVFEAVRAELEDLFYRVGEPGGTIFLSQINEAISQASGEINHVLTAPVADIVLDDDEIAIVGTIS